MNGQEVGHVGRYDLLPFDATCMEFVRAAGGRLPRGRRPVQGGHEEDGSILYHAVATFGNVRVPGRTAEHLVSGRVSVPRAASSICVRHSGGRARATERPRVRRRLGI